MKYITLLFCLKRCIFLFSDCILDNKFDGKEAKEECSTCGTLTRGNYMDDTDKLCKGMPEYH